MTNRTTRDLAYRWVAALGEGGLSDGGPASPACDELTTSDFRLHLPRSTAALLAGAGADTPRDRFRAVMDAAGGLFDIAGTTLVRRGFDIFDGDRGGLQFTLRLHPRDGVPFALLIVLTFERAGDRLAAVRIHADTAMFLRGLRPEPAQASV